MDLKMKAIERLARQLAHLGCEYMIVPDGDAARAIQRGKFTHHKKLPRGECTRYVESFISDLEPGGTVLIPVADYPLTTLVACASASAYKLFGKGNYMTGRTDDEAHVEVLCLDKDPSVNTQPDLFTGEE